MTEKIINEINLKLIEYANQFYPKSMSEPYHFFIENGGKRIRPLLCLLTIAISGKNYKDYIDLANSLELLHTFTLLHDDIMDQSPIRRGKPTIHIKWNESIAILLGDLIIGHSYRKLSKYVEHNNFSKMLNVFNDSLVIVCEGQALDIDYNSRTDIDENDYLEMIEGKTANLIKASIQIGALIANFDEKKYDILSEFGKNIGLAFQIQDDYLDLFAQGSGFGKTIGRDLLEGKKTLMIIKLNKIAEGEDREIINNFYLNNGCQKNEIQTIINLIEKYKIKEEVKLKFERLYSSAQKELLKLGNNKYISELDKLLTEMNSRNK